MHSMDSPPVPKRLSGRFRASAFSLIEVVLALGIISFAYVAIFGLFPAGMQTYRAAMDTGNEGRIVQDVLSRAQAAHFRNLDALAQASLSYDDEGNATADTARLLYMVRVFFEDARVPNSDTPTTSAKTMLVVVANVASPGFAEFKSITDIGKARTSKSVAGLRVRSFLLTKMDALPTPS